MNFGNLFVSKDWIACCIRAISVCRRPKFAQQGTRMATTLTQRGSLAQRYAEEFPKSQQLHRQATSMFPNGVTHDLRFLQPFPVYVERAAGSRKWDVDGPGLIYWWR